MSVYFNTSTSVNESLFGTTTSLNVSEVVLGSYSSLGTRVINGTVFTLVNFTDVISFNDNSTTGGANSENESGIIYFDPTWNATLISLDGYNITGTYASTVGADLMIFFELPFVYTTFESSLNLVSETLHEVNETTANFGNVTLRVTNYNYTSTTLNSMTTSSTSSSDCAINAPQVNATGYGTLQMGQLPSDNATILTGLTFYSDMPGIGTSSGLFQIESLTLAPESTTTVSSSSTATTETTTLSTI